jgi:hypothetical protein
MEGKWAWQFNASFPPTHYLYVVWGYSVVISSALKHNYTRGLLITCIAAPKIYAPLSLFS